MQTPDVTGMLRAWAAGDVEARDQLVPLVYEELRRRAVAHMRRERAGHTLQPTALVHEAYVRMGNQERAAWQNRAQFFAVAACVMRRILVDHARAKKSDKRSGQWVKVTIGEHMVASQPDIDVLALDEALTRLAAFDTRKSQVAELRFFSGLSTEEVAGVLGVSVATIGREWAAAKAWLYAAMK